MDTQALPEVRRGHLWRSRWAAIGAAVAVTFGAGGLAAVNAASSAPSAVVTIDPVRILDTRDPVNIGLPGPFVSAVSQKLTVTGAAVPAGATGVLLNVTVVSPSANGFLSIRPGDAVGAATTSSLNFNAGQIVPNSVQVGVPTAGADAGKIDITYDAYGVAGPTTDVLIDVVGYTIEQNHDDRYYTETESDALLAGRVADPTVVRNTVNIGGGGETGINFFAICPDGLRATGGGVGAANGGSVNDRVIFSGPTDSSGNFTATVTGDIPTRWAGRYFNGSASAVDVYVWAICG